MNSATQNLALTRLLFRMAPVVALLAAATVAAAVSVESAKAVNPGSSSSLHDEAEAAGRALAKSGYSVNVVDASTLSPDTLTTWAADYDRLSYAEEPSTPQTLKSMFQNATAPFIITEYDGHLVGFVKARTEEYENFGRETFIDQVTTDEHHRRKGIAQAMILTLLTAIDNAPARLSVWETNEYRAHALYTRLGFENVYRYPSGSVQMRRAGNGSPNKEMSHAEAGVSDSDLERFRNQMHQIETLEN